MDDILDHEKKEQPKKRRYAVLSFVFSLITSNLLIYFWGSMPASIVAGEGIPSFSNYGVLAIELSCLLGIVYSVISIVKKEKWGFYKIAGLLINAFLLFFLLGSVIFANLV